MHGDTPFMPWIDHLHEVGDPIQRERGKLRELAQRALDLEREACALRDQAGVLRQHNLLCTATEEERAQTLGRLLAWWNHVGRPVCERVAVKYNSGPLSALEPSS